MEISSNNWHPWQLKKNQNPRGPFGATSLTALPIQPIHKKEQVFVDILDEL